MSNFYNLKRTIEREEFDVICFYNSKKVYEALMPFKNNKKIKLVEIYHSDFTWGDSISSINDHHVDWIVRVSGLELAII